MEHPDGENDFARCDEHSEIQLGYWYLLASASPVIPSVDVPRDPNIPLDTSEHATESGPEKSKATSSKSLRDRKDLKNFIALVEGNHVDEEQDHAPKRSPGRLIVDQSTPIIQLGEVKARILEVGPSGASELPEKPRLRAKAVLEILETEHAYVKSLDIVVELLIIPLRKSASDPDAESIIEKDDINIIFAEIETIRNLNVTFLKNLQNRLEQWNSQTLLGDVLLELAPYFKCYNFYVDNYPRAVNKVKELEQRNPAFRNFLVLFHNHERTSKLGIQDFLIKPIQRIPRYLMLFDAVLKYTPDDHPDRKNLELAIAQYKKVADYVNTKAAENENRLKVYEIQNKLKGNPEIVAPARKYIRDGEIFLQPPHNALRQKRNLYLFSDMLMTSESVYGMEVQEHVMDLRKAITVDRSDEPHKHLFWFVVPGQTLLFWCATKEEKTTWLAEINLAISALVANNPHLQQQRNQCVITTNSDNTPALVDPSAKEVEPQESRRKGVLESTLSWLASWHQGYQTLPPVSSTKLFQSESVDDGMVDLGGSNLSDGDGGFVLLRDALPGEQLDEALSSNLLLNKGTITIPTREIQEVSGDVIWKEDRRFESTFPVESTYLVFSSFQNSFYVDIGTITLHNKGPNPVLLVSHLRRSPAMKSSYFKLAGDASCTCDFRGWWAIEVRQGDCSKLEVVEFKNSGSHGHNKTLEMF